MRRRSRLERAEQLETANARLAAGQPQRQVAADLGLARSTLQEWCKPVAAGAAPAALAAWVETAEGVRWLHQLVWAAHFSIPCRVMPEFGWCANFLSLLLEQYAADRKAATWTQALQAALVGLNVAVIQGTSDEATASHRQVEVDRDAHHSPDLFHGQHEVSKATSLHLARQVRQAAATVTAAQTRWAVERAAQQAYEDPLPRPCGRPPAFAPP